MAWVPQGRRQLPSLTRAKSVGSTAIDGLSGKANAIIGAGLVAASTVAVADTRVSPRPRGPATPLSSVYPLRPVLPRDQ